MKQATKRLSNFIQSSRNSCYLLKFSLGISICIWCLLLFRIVLYQTGFGVKVGQQVYLHTNRNITIERTMDIVMSADDGYIHNSATTIASILLNCDASSNFRFHILDGGITSDKKEKLIKLKKLRNFDIYFYDMTKYDWSMFPNNRDHITLATYYRLRIPEVLPKNIQKALYLDGDMIVEQDLKELWDTDISDYVLGAVEDEEGIDSKNRLNLRNKYFNAGVLLLNLKKLQQINLLDNSLQYLKKNSRYIIYQDQDILNGLFNEKYKDLPLKWNVNSGMYTNSKLQHSYSHNTQKLIRKAPGIIHFTGEKLKPWYWGWLPHPMSDEYWKYLKHTEFYSSTKRQFVFSKRISHYKQRIQAYFNNNNSH